MKDVSDVSLKKGVGIAAVALVALHVVLSLIFMLTAQPAKHAGLVGEIYMKLMLIGPFFNESRIKTSPHLYVRTYENGRWSEARDFAMENQVFYRSHPWRYDKLRINYFERYIAKKVSLSDSGEWQRVSGSASFRELNQFVLQEYIGKPADSLSLVYGVNRYFPDTNTIRFDTLFEYSYIPAEVGRARTSY